MSIKSSIIEDILNQNRDIAKTVQLSVSGTQIINKQGSSK